MHLAIAGCGSSVPYARTKMKAQMPYGLEPTPLNVTVRLCLVGDLTESIVCNLSNRRHIQVRTAIAAWASSVPPTNRGWLMHEVTNSSQVKAVNECKTASQMSNSYAKIDDVSTTIYATDTLVWKSPEGLAC